jgi:hypothetical protein
MQLIKQHNVFEKIDSKFERSYTISKMLSNSIAFYRETFYKRKSQSMQQTSFFSFKKFPKLPQPLATTMLTSKLPSTLGKIFPCHQAYYSHKAQVHIVLIIDLQ